MSDLVTQFSRLLDESSFTQRELADGAGLAHNAVFSWTKKTKSPGLLNFDAALQVLGYKLAIVSISPDAPVFLTQEESDARSDLIYEAIRFANWAAGEGISPNDDQPAGDPEEFMVAYSAASGDEDWETLADRISGRSRSAQRAGEGGGS